MVQTHIKFHYFEIVNLLTQHREEGKEYFLVKQNGSVSLFCQLAHPAYGRGQAAWAPVGVAGAARATVATTRRTAWEMINM